jgi:16S rRNA (cytidine1402-2'-O)-methyltransferase
MIDKNLENALYIVATPIGNLEDITIRAIETLKNVDVIICEDSRVTNKLLEKYQIKNKKLLIYNDHSSEHDRVKILNLLQQKLSLALVSDAGTPLISDPGHKLVEFLRLQNYKMIPIPGASSITAALSTCGIACDNFLFMGFLPSSKIQRRNLIKTLPKNYSLVFFESAKRLNESLYDIKQILGNRKVSIARELTKIHEEIVTDSVENIINFYSNEETTNDKAANDLADNKDRGRGFNIAKGEIVIVISKLSRKEKLYDDEEVISKIKQALEAKVSIKDLSSQIADIYQLNKKDVYNLALNIINSNN